MMSRTALGFFEFGCGFFSGCGAITCAYFTRRAWKKRGR